MAKRRKDPDEVDEDKPFKMPKFDEEAFLTRERRNIKATFIAFFFGCLVALISFGFWALMGKHYLRWELVLLVVVVTFLLDLITVLSSFSSNLITISASSIKTCSKPLIHNVVTL